MINEQGSIYTELFSDVASLVYEKIFLELVQRKGSAKFKGWYCYAEFPGGGKIDHAVKAAH